MNKKIVAAAVLVGASGAFKAASAHQPLTPVVTGAYIFLLALAILDMFGGQASTLAGALAMLAALYVLLTEFPWQALVGLANKK